MMDRRLAGGDVIARSPPHIYTAHDIARIMRAARQMPTKGFIGPETLTTLLGLLASTGLRISEALSLQCSDVGDDGLIIRKSKYGNPRRHWFEIAVTGSARGYPVLGITFRTDAGQLAL